VVEELVADIEGRLGARVEHVPSVGPRRGQRVHVLDKHWATLEPPPRPVAAAAWADDVAEDKRANMYERAGLYTFLAAAGFDGKTEMAAADLVGME